MWNLATYKLRYIMIEKSNVKQIEKKILVLQFLMIYC